MPGSTRNGYLLLILAMTGLVSACGNTVDVRVSATDAPDPPQSTPVTGTGSVTLSWIPPNLNTDATPLLDLAGYRVYSGRAATTLSPLMRIESTGITMVVVDGLSSGTHYFAVSAIAASGNESALSAVGRKTIP